MADQVLDLTAFAPSSGTVLDLEQFAPPKAEKPGILVPSIKRTAGQMVGATGVALEDLGLKTRLPEIGKAITEAYPAQIQQPSDILEKPGTFLGESVSEMIPQLGVYAAGAWSGAKLGARLGAFAGPKGAVVGGAAGGLIGGLAPIFTQEYGEIREIQKKEGAENVATALAGAGAATALERAFGLEKMVGKALKAGALDTIKEGVSRPLHMLKQGTLGALIEGPGTEFPQTAIERLAGGAPLANEEAIADYIISSAKGAAGGGVISAGLAGLSPRAKQEVAPEVAPEAPPVAEAPAGPPEPLNMAEFIKSTRAEADQSPMGITEFARSKRPAGDTSPVKAKEAKAAKAEYDAYKQAFLAGQQAEYEAYKQAFINDQFGVQPLTPEQRNQIIINQTPTEVPGAAPVEPVAAPVQKTRMAEPTIIGEQPAPAPAAPIITAKEAELLRIAEKETGYAPDQVEVQGGVQRQRGEGAVGGQAAAAIAGDRVFGAAKGQEGRAQSVKVQVALLKQQKGEPLTVQERAAVRAYERTAPAIETPAVQTTPRFRGRQFSGAERRENFVNAYSSAVDTALADLTAQGVVAPSNKLRRAASLLKRSAEAAVMAKDDAAGMAILDEAMGKALRGIIPKAEVEVFRQKLTDATQAALPETLMSKAATSAAWTPARVSRLLKIYAYPGDAQRSKAFAAQVHPQDFLNLTANVDHQARIDYETFNLAPDLLAKESQEIFLDVDYDPATGAAKVVSHEGRHRMTALMRAGVTSVPITINTREGAARPTNVAMTLFPQRHVTAASSVSVTAVPLTYANRAAIEAMQPNAAITFSRAAVDEVIAAKADEIRNTIAGMIGTPKDLVVEAAPRVAGGAGMIQFGELRDIIAVSLQASDAGSVAAHEGFHYLDKRVLTGPERRVIRQAFASGSRLHRMLVAKAEAYDAANGTDITSEIRAIPAEARAYGFEFWRRGELEAQGMIAKVFQKLARVMERIRNYVDGLGFTSYEDLFAMIRRGEYAQRDLSGIREFEREVMRSRAQREASEQAFYSALGEAIADIKKVAGKDGMIAPAQAKAWLAARQKEGRFRAAELEAVGLAEWLDLQQGKVSVADIENFVREHGVTVEETLLGEVAIPGGVVRQDLNGDWEIAFDPRSRSFATREEAEAAAGTRTKDTTKFSQWQLPGGENYRELLLRLPTPDAKDVSAKVAALDARIAGYGATGADLRAQYPIISERPPEIQNRIQMARDLMQELMDQRKEALVSKDSTFRSSHFDQPNILAHVRFNERIDADGKRVLFLEELQSDWAQRGRKEGFIQQVSSRTHEIGPAMLSSREGALSGFGVYRKGELDGDAVVVFKTRGEAEAFLASGATEDSTYGRVPSTPFVTETKAWVALALKRMIRYAAENGFDRVAWTTGEQQAARYDLSKHVREIEVHPNSDSTYDLTLTMPDGATQQLRNIAENALEDNVGKDLAKKIIEDSARWVVANKEYRDALKKTDVPEAQLDALRAAREAVDLTYSGLDLKVGGEGMKAFYDKIVPQVANEVLKKFGGGKVGGVRLAQKHTAQGNYIERGNGGYEVFYADGASYGVYPTREAAGMALAKIERTHPSPAPELKPTTEQPGFDITPALKAEAMAGLPLFSKAATESIQDIGRRFSEGDLQREQVNAHLMGQLDRPDMRDLTERLAEKAGFEMKALGASLRRMYHGYIGSGLNRARASQGYANVFGVMTHFIQRKAIIFERAIAKDLSTWVKDATKQDKTVVSKAMLDATVKGLARDSAEYHALMQPLTQEQRAMADQAWTMIGKMLDAEFVAEQAKYRKLFADDAKFNEWFENRKVQVEQLKKNSYFPERRYGDYFVHAYVEAPDGKKITVYYEQYERPAAALKAEAEFKDIFGKEGLKVEQGHKHKVDYDGSVSIGQFLDLAQRHGIALTQAEKERLGRALIKADSTRRNRLFRRQNVAGYSQDGMRVLAEFAVSMSNKIAYAEMGDALQDSLQGRQVDVAFTKDGTVTINTQAGTNLWQLDGPDAGFFRNLADEKVGFVMSPESRSTVSNKLRAMATVYFLGGSVAAAGVNLSSLPMITLPWLTQHTNAAKATATLLEAMRIAGANFNAIRDLPTLLGTTPIEGVDNVEGLRHALQIAAQDGSLFDTEIYQFMGLSRGQEYSLSGRTQEAVKLWMTPFRLAEQYNRVSAFIAAYKVAKGNNLGNEAAHAQAQEAVFGTQFRYDEANRPALADSGVGSLFFVFKSFPIFMMETMTFLAKTNPKSAVFMLGMLVLMAGVEGLPFAEDLEDLIDVLAQRLFNEPFNSKRWLRNTLKSASEAVVGADLSGVLMHGVANSLTGLNFASRVGAGNLIPGTRIGAADVDYRRAMDEILGPVGGMASGVVSGVDALSKGNFLEAAKQGLPLAAKNAVKGWEQFEKGYATDAGGRKLVDVGSWEAFWQSLGFSSAALSQVYESDQIDRRTTAFYNDVRTQFNKEMIAAIREGDRAAANEVGQAIMAWNQAHPDMPVAMSPASLRRQVALAGMPLNQRTLLTMPKYLRGQSEAAIGLAAE